MSVELSTIEEQALKLPMAQRARLAQRLIASLDEMDVAENERTWVEEGERRYQQYKKGRLASRSAADVFGEAFARFS